VDGVKGDGVGGWNVRFRDASLGEKQPAHAGCGRRGISRYYIEHWLCCRSCCSCCRRRSRQASAHARIFRATKVHLDLRTNYPAWVQVSSRKRPPPGVKPPPRRALRSCSANTWLPKDMIDCVRKIGSICTGAQLGLFSVRFGAKERSMRGRIEVRFD
jgi:hypothetical protein